MITWSKNDKYGSYTIEIQGRILNITLKGAMGLSLSKSYVNDVIAASENLIGRPWGYFACALDFDASTYDADSVITNAYKQCMSNGCIVDTYCINSPVAKNQLQTIRRKLRIESSIEERLFENQAQAFAFINEVLASTKVEQ